MISVSTLIYIRVVPTYRKKQEAAVYTACEIKHMQCFQHRSRNYSDLIFLPAHKEETYAFGNHLSYLVVMPSGSWVMVISHIVGMLSVKL
jgi:hypothetical protein